MWVRSYAFILSIFGIFRNGINLLIYILICRGSFVGRKRKSLSMFCVSKGQRDTKVDAKQGDGLE